MNDYVFLWKNKEKYFYDKNLFQQKFLRKFLSQNKIFYLIFHKKLHSFRNTYRELKKPINYQSNTSFYFISLFISYWLNVSFLEFFSQKFNSKKFIIQLKNEKNY